MMQMNGSSRSVGRKNYNASPTYISVFPMYGLWDGKQTFKSSKEADYKKSDEHDTHNKNVDRSHFRKMYFEKVYMEELLKSKNMMMNKK